MTKYLGMAAAAVLLAGCADRSTIVAPVADREGRWDDGALVADDHALRVMTYNVYYGTDPSPLLAVQNPADVPVIAAQIWALARQTNFPERAGALARQIAKKRPHLVGLQEAALYRIQSPGDAALGGTTPATEVVYDFLALLVDSLAARGLHYVVADADSTSDVEVPVLTGFDPATGVPTFDDVRLTDRDAVLARADVQFTDPQHGVYAAFIPVLGAGVYEGWSSVVATIRKRAYRFVSTHLEFQQALPVQLAQAEELIGLLANETRPTILVGDFNSDVLGKVPGQATESYGMIRNAGFADAWRSLEDHGHGATCCENDSVNNPFPTLDRRLDFVFTRHLPRHDDERMRAVDGEVVGDRLRDRTASGLWPSDHAGVAITFAWVRRDRHDGKDGHRDGDEKEHDSDE